MDDSNLIQASSVRCQTMADGALRIMFEIDAGQQNEAFQLFGAPGSPAVIARLTDDAAKSDMQKKAAGDNDRKPKGPHGKLASSLYRNGFFSSPDVQMAIETQLSETVEYIGGYPDAFKRCLNVDSLTYVSREVMLHWATQNNVAWALPKEYKETSL